MGHCTFSPQEVNVLHNCLNVQQDTRNKRRQVFLIRGGPRRLILLVPCQGSALSAPRRRIRRNDAYRDLRLKRDGHRTLQQLYGEDQPAVVRVR